MALQGWLFKNIILGSVRMSLSLLSIIYLFIIVDFACKIIMMMMMMTVWSGVEGMALR